MKKTQKKYMFISIILLLAFQLTYAQSVTKLYNLPKTKFSAKMRFHIDYDPWPQENPTNKDIGNWNISEKEHHYYRTIFKFDLSQLPPNAAVSKATLKTEVTKYEYYDPDFVAIFSTVDNDFDLDNYESYFNNVDENEIGGYNYKDTSKNYNITSRFTPDVLNDKYLLVFCKSYHEYPNNSMAELDVNLDIEYFTDPINITAKNNFSGGLITVDGTPNLPAPYTFSKQATNSASITAQDQNDSSGYNRIWNDTEAPAAKSEWAKVDKNNTPIALDQNKRLLSTYQFNVNASDYNAKYTANLRKLCNISRVNSYEGVNVNQTGYSNKVEQNSFAVSTPSSTSYNGRTYYFSNWSDDASAGASRTFTPTQHETLTANYKGVQVANDASAYTNNSQRKIVRTEDGWLHQTYSSMGHVWIEHSTNNGTSWFIGNNGQPLDNGEGKCPSIDYWHDNIEHDDYYIVVAYQQKIANNYSGLRYTIFKKTGSETSYNRTSTYGKTIIDLTGESYTNNLNPGLTIGKFSYGTPYFALTYEKKTSTGGAPGIYWIYGQVSEYGFGIAGYVNGSSQFLEDVISGPNLIDGTDANYSNASVNLNKSVNRSQGYFYVVYQKYISSTRSEILKSKLKCYSTASNSWLHIDYGSVKISNSADYKSYKPSMVEMSDTNIRVCWIRNLYGQSSMPYWMNAVYWRSNASSTYTVLGQFVRNISININDDYDLSTAKTPFVWSQDLYGWENYISNGSSYTKLSTTGYDVQMSNGINTDDMVVSAYTHNTAPYYFTNTGNIGGTYSKSSNADINYGRGLALNKDELNFNYSIKSLMVDGGSIKFVEIPENEPDTTNADRGIKYLKLKELNEMLLSEPFTIDERSEFLFTDDAGFIDTKAAEEVLGKNGNINCKIELIDDATGKVIGLINETEYSAANLPQGKISNYSLNTDGIEKKTARVKITISSNINNLQGVFVSEYGTMDKQELAKAATQTLELKNSELVTSYNLEQNYPNPFNPSTMIRYQLPKTSEVSLKVYDVLGKEVATLVNKTQAEGRYEVKFDASHLSSGVYIYRIEAGEYTATHKMMMLK